MFHLQIHSVLIHSETEDLKINGRVCWTRCPVVSCLLPAVVTLFLEFWKRYQAQLEYQWDTVEFLEQGQPSRPEYEAKCIYERKNPITGVNHTLTLPLHNETIAT